MKKSKYPHYKVLCYLIPFVCLLLGVSSCLTDGELDGELNANTTDSQYTINGNVVNEQNVPVPDVQLILKELRTTPYNEWVMNADTIYTDTKGKFTVDIEYTSQVNYRIIHRDIDKDGNIRRYKTDTVNIEQENIVNEAITIVLKLNTNEE